METLHELWQYLQETYFSAEIGNHYLHLNFRGMHTSLLVILGGLCLGLLIGCFISFFNGRAASRLVLKLKEKEAFAQNSALTLEELDIKPSVFLKQELSHPSLLRKWIAFAEGEKIYTYKGELREAFPDYAQKAAETSVEASSSPDASYPSDTPENPSERKNEPVDREKEKSLPENTQPTGKKKKEKEPSFRLHSPDLGKARFFLPEENRESAVLYYSKRGGNIFILLLSVVFITALFFLSLRFLPTLISLLDVSIDKWINH